MLFKLMELRCGQRQTGIGTLLAVPIGRMSVRCTMKHNRGSILVPMAVLIAVVSGGLIGSYYIGPSPVDVSSGLEPAPAQSSGARAPVSPTSRVVLQVADSSHEYAWAELGLTADGGLDAKRARRVLTAIKSKTDQGPRNASLDLEGLRVVRARTGHSLDVAAAIAELEAAVAVGHATIQLPAVALPPEVTTEDLGIDDISAVLASFKTKFAVTDRRRNDNLKLAASKLNGHVMQPGALFSFNDTVGARSEQEGYKIAHVISQGEMVDGLAGGTCQISTTLHGAAFFSGIEIVSSTPHSRPSTYVPMGLDATVVYPHTDLKLRNSYDFPVAIHYRVARGEAVVRILGKERPYDEIAFERAIKRKIDFETVTREDGEIPIGSMLVDQHGYFGWNLVRHRKYYKDGKLVKTDRWPLRYRPVTEYARIGTNPDPNLTPPKQKRGHGPKMPSHATARIVQ